MRDVSAVSRRVAPVSAVMISAALGQSPGRPLIDHYSDKIPSAPRQSGSAETSRHVAASPDSGTGNAPRNDAKCCNGRPPPCGHRDKAADPKRSLSPAGRSRSGSVAAYPWYSDHGQSLRVLLRVTRLKNAPRFLFIPGKKAHQSVIVCLALRVQIRQVYVIALAEATRCAGMLGAVCHRHQCSKPTLSRNCQMLLVLLPPKGPTE